jgi:hypothetical protein
MMTRRRTPRQNMTESSFRIAGVSMLLMCGRWLAAQSISPTAGAIQDFSAQAALPQQFSVEPEIQYGTQGTSIYANPFAYSHGVQNRLWVHYDGFRDLTITASPSYIYYFAVPGTSNYRHPEWRFTVLGTLKQRFWGASLYEQARFELLDFRAGNGDVQHLPRMRLRVGQNIHLAERRSKPYLGFYEEAITQYPQASYSGVHFQGARFFGGCGFDYRKRASVLVGFKAEAEVSNSGSTVTLFYGPVFSLQYNLGRGEPNEKHKRTTAFKDF